MNDFSELENDLRALRPARPSPVLFERIEEAMAEDCRAPVSGAGQIRKWFWRFTETPYRFGIGLVAAAAAVVLLLARITCVRNKTGSAWLLWSERHRRIDVLQQIRSRWRDAGCL
jgi:hypothetical protein